jgi:methyl-accepting chemotaxis protein
MGINNFKMQTKLLLLSCVGAFGMLVVGVISTNSLNQANHSLEDLNQGIHNVKKFAAMKNRLLTTRLDVVYMMSLEDDARLAEKNSDMKSQIQAIEALVKHVRALTNGSSFSHALDPEKPCILAGKRYNYHRLIS